MEVTWFIACRAKLNHVPVVTFYRKQVCKWKRCRIRFFCGVLNVCNECARMLVWLLLLLRLHYWELKHSIRVPCSLQKLYNSIKSEPFKVPEDETNGEHGVPFYNPVKCGWLCKRGETIDTYLRRSCSCSRVACRQFEVQLSESNGMQPAVCSAAAAFGYFPCHHELCVARLADVRVRSSAFRIKLQDGSLREISAFSEQEPAAIIQTRAIIWLNLMQVDVSLLWCRGWNARVQLVTLARPRKNSRRSGDS